MNFNFPLSVSFKSVKQVAFRGGLGLLVLLALAQLIPYGRDHSPKPATNPFRWRSPEAEAIARVACYDCHSGETHWWWGVKIAPMSWLAQSDIDEGRQHLDFSAWNGRLRPQGLARALHEGMPPIQFTLLHPKARLSEAQKQVLVRGFQASLSGDASIGESSTLLPVSSPSAKGTEISNACLSFWHSPNYGLGYQRPSPVSVRNLIDQTGRHEASVCTQAEQVLADCFAK